MKNNFEADSYFGMCCVCGHYQEFKRILRAIRETYRCSHCKASLREREQMQQILNCYKKLIKSLTLVDLVENKEFQKLHIYEPGTIGVFRSFFKKLPHYYQSDFYPEAQRINIQSNIPHQNIEKLSFSSNLFDLIITSDILEHVRHPDAAFSEIARVLKPGGVHVCSLPFSIPIPVKTISRVDVSSDKDIPLLPLHYHGNGKGGKSLVYNDYGLDIIDICDKYIAVKTVLYKPNPRIKSNYANSIYTLISTKEKKIFEKTTMKICNICENSSFKPAPFGRLSSTMFEPLCTKCGSLERHRIFRKIFNSIRTQEFKNYTCLMFSSDPSIAHGWFSSVEQSIYKIRNSLNLESIDRVNSSYDVIVCNHVLEHIKNYELGISEMARVLKDNGFIFLSFPNPYSRDVTVEWGYPDINQHGHYRIFGRDIENEFIELLPNYSIIAIEAQDPVTLVYDMVYIITKSTYWFNRMKESNLQVRMITDHCT